MADNKEFNPFDYRPFLVREWTLEQFAEDNKKLWDEVWVAYQKRAKTHSIPKTTKQDVLNDVRYLLVNASKHNLKQISKKYCNVLADSEALASVAQKLLDDMNSDINIPRLDLSIQGEDPQLIPYIILKSGMSFKFLQQLKDWFHSLDKKDADEKLRDIYNDEEIVRLMSLLSFYSYQMAVYYKIELFRMRPLFCKDNCPVSDDVFLPFVKQLFHEISEGETKYTDFCDIYLPLYAAKQAGCLRKITKGKVMGAFPEVGDVPDKNFTPLNQETANLTDEQAERLKKLRETFAKFLPLRENDESI